MDHESYFYNCSPEYVKSLSPELLEQVLNVVGEMQKRPTQSELNQDLWWLLVSQGWSYDSTPQGLPDSPPTDLNVPAMKRDEAQRDNDRDLCLTSTTLDAKWRADFAKTLNGDLVQIEAQFGKVEAMFKDFCGFRIASYERRLSLGIEIVMCDPGRFFAHRRAAVSGMADFEIAKKMLPALELGCPIWLIGVREGGPDV